MADVHLFICNFSVYGLSVQYHNLKTVVYVLRIPHFLLEEPMRFVCTLLYLLIQYMSGVYISFLLVQCTSATCTLIFVYFCMSDAAWQRHTLPIGD